MTAPMPDARFHADDLVAGPALEFVSANLIFPSYSTIALDRRLLRTLYELLISSLRFAVSNEYGGGKTEIHMPLIQEISAEQLARLFHHYQAALTFDFSGYMKEDPGASWEAAPENERKLMIAAARLTLLELVSPHEAKPNRSYFAKAGEAEWGC